MRSLTSSSILRSSSARDRLGVADVEAQPVGRDQRALLRDVRAEMAAQRLVQQMRRRMMRAQLGAADRIDRHDDVVADLDLALVDRGVMGMQVAHHLLHVGDRGLAAGADEAAGVALLAARLGIERRLVDDQPAGLAGLERRRFLAVDDDRRDLALGALGVVAQELGGADLLAHVEPDRLVGRVARAGPRRARLGALLVHRLLEARRVDGDVARAQHVLRQVEREAEGVVELEGDLALQRAAGAQAPGLVVEQLEAGAERPLEARLLELQRLGDQRLGADQLGIGIAHLLHQGRHQLVDHRILRAEDVRMAHGAAHDAAQHVAAALVGGQHAVGDQERGRAQMVGDHLVRRRLRAVGIDAGLVRHRLDQGAEQIDVVVVVLVLQDRGEALQPHAGVDRRLGQRHARLLGHAARTA